MISLTFIPFIFGLLLLIYYCVNINKRQKEGSKIRDSLVLIFSTNLILFSLINFILEKFSFEIILDDIAIYYFLSYIVQINATLIGLIIMPVSIFFLILDRYKTLEQNNNWPIMSKKKDQSNIIKFHYVSLFAVCIYMILIIILGLIGIVFNINGIFVLTILISEFTALAFLILSAYLLFDLFEFFARVTTKDN